MRRVKAKALRRMIFGEDAAPRLPAESKVYKVPFLGKLYKSVEGLFHTRRAHPLRRKYRRAKKAYNNLSWRARGMV